MAETRAAVDRKVQHDTNRTAEPTATTLQVIKAPNQAEKASLAIEKTLLTQSVTSAAPLPDYSIETVMDILLAYNIPIGSEKAKPHAKVFPKKPTPETTYQGAGPGPEVSSKIALKKEEFNSKPTNTLEQDAQKKARQEDPETAYVYFSLYINDDSLWIDQCMFFMAHHHDDKKLQQRRFALLLPLSNQQTHTLIIELSNLNNVALKKLRELLDQDTMDESQLIQNKTFIYFLKQLYKKITLTYIGANKLPLDLLSPMFKKSYIGEFIVKKCYALPPQCSHVHLVQFILNILEGKAEHLVKEPIETQRIVELHQQTIIEKNLAAERELRKQEEYKKRKELKDLKLSFITQLSQISDKELQFEIALNLIILFKHGYIIKERDKQQSEVELIKKNGSIDQLQNVLTLDHVKKIAVYKHKINLKTAINSFDNTFLRQLKEKIQQPEQLSLEIWENRKSTYTQVQKWETDIQAVINERLKKWKPFLRHYGAKALHNLYNQSWVGTGGSLLKWMLGSCARSKTQKANNSVVLKKSQKIIKNSILNIYRANKRKISKEQEALIEKKLKQWINIKNLYYLMGAGVGLWWSLSLTPWSFTRQVIIMLLSTNFYKLIQNFRLNDETAQFFDSFESLTPLHCSYLSQLFMVYLEYRITQNPRYLILGGFGATGGFTAVRTLLHYVPDLEKPATPKLAKEAQQIRFLIHMSGNSFAYFLAECCFQGYDAFNIIQHKNAVRQKLYEFFKPLEDQNVIQDFKVRSPFPLSPFKPYQALQHISQEINRPDTTDVVLLWRYPNEPFFQQGACQLKNVQGQEFQTAVNCFPVNSVDVPLLTYNPSA